MPRRLLVPTSVAVAVLLLAGCGAPAPSAPTPTAAAATGETISGGGYTYSVPEGWGIPDTEVPGYDPDSYAMDLGDADGFSDNVNVTVGPGEASPADIESQGVTELEGVGGTGIEVLPRITVAGVESAHLSGTLTSSGVGYLIDQYYLSRDGQTFIVTFSFSETVSQADRDELAQSVLASWTWG